ncbi:hypothetical protein V8G54_016063 [Vigna mungo]|uniref:Uncharacterized protein n=1 Tax=Vigna mungo TaxID=3915 RepID=A0AAQ3NM69_VIGMU
MRKFLGHIKSIADELASIGLSVTPEEYTDAILVGLSLEYAPTIKSKFEMPQITVEAILHAHESSNNRFLRSTILNLIINCLQKFKNAQRTSTTSVLLIVWFMDIVDIVVVADLQTSNAKSFSNMKILSESHDLEQFPSLKLELSMRQPLCLLGD